MSAQEQHTSAESDMSLTDHEWRLKMAAEGKAFYLPGKSVDEVKANAVEMGLGRDLRFRSRTVTLTSEDWSNIDTAIPDLIEMVHDIKTIFQDLSYAEKLDKEGIWSILRLAGRAVQSLEDKEVQVLDLLDTAIRSAKEDAV